AARALAFMAESAAFFRPWPGKHGTTERRSGRRRGALLGVPGAMQNLAVLLKRRGKVQQALEWYRKAAARALAFMAESAAFFRPWPGKHGTTERRSGRRGNDNGR
ncbi:hypothetical protein, partial [Streptomyces sp. NPDC001292]|uniref:hypothetical protein n=1 Tax=Streptomyces sp. NPDC001292 TaxID=3364558 RepID=UPI0036CA4F23